jgi:hypothetical protein
MRDRGIAARRLNPSAAVAVDRSWLSELASDHAAVAAQRDHAAVAAQRDHDADSARTGAHADDRMFDDVP